MSEDRAVQTQRRLYAILKHKGVIFTLGMCMGILMRLSRHDYALYKEIEHRHDRLTGK